LTGIPGRRLVYLAITLAVVAADRITKMVVEARLDPYRSINVIPGLFDLTLVRNPGGVFGIFKELDPAFRAALFTLVPVIAILLIAFYATRVPASHRSTQISLALILGGAVGNLIDRLRSGYVTDFLDIYWRDHHWPAFNIADSAICTGVALLLIETMFLPGGAAGQEDTRPVEPSRSDTP